MAKEKKISANYFLRKTALKSGYDVYCRVIYDKKSTNFPTEWRILQDDIEKAELELSQLDTSIHSKKVIEAIKNDINILGKHYTIAGFPERWRLYNCKLSVLTSYGIGLRLNDKIENILTYKQYKTMYAVLDGDDYFEPYGSITYYEFFRIYFYLKKNFNFDIVDSDMSILLYLDGIITHFEKNATDEIIQKVKEIKEDNEDVLLCFNAAIDGGMD